MAKKKNTQPVKKQKLTDEQRLHYENLTVLATAIVLVSLIFMLYLYRYYNSTMIVGTQLFLSVLIWISDAVILFCLGMYFWKKNFKFIKLMVYFVAGGALLAVLRYFFAIKNFFDMTGISGLWGGLWGLFGTVAPAAITTAFWFVGICLFGYLVATYIYCGLKLKK